MLIKKLILGILISLMCIGCASNEIQYTSISMEEAKERLEEEKDYILVDVRREEEYITGHLPGAICIPNESIEDQTPKELPDLNQTIFVYCRSGNRSKQAAQKLVDMGYSHIIEIGGILDWTGEIIN